MTDRLDTALAVLADAAARLRARAAAFRQPADPAGAVRAFDGQVITVEGLSAPSGTLVRIEAGDACLTAEAIGFSGAELLLMPLARGPVTPGALAYPLGRRDFVAVGQALLGRVSDGLGEPADGLGPMPGSRAVPLDGVPLPPLARGDVTEALPTGVRAIDGLLTLGRGQRIGLVAGSGVGKTTLMLDLVAQVVADVRVVALIGERGREIAGFVEQLTPEARSRTHVVAVPADAAPALRLRGVRRALAIAESFRADGAQVLFVLDSLTRVAHAQREIGLAAGEPVGLRGYPASALALVARLVERSGNDRLSGGSVTAVFTVLADGDDVVTDPVVDAARGTLDGHVVLTREVAARGRFPAIDPTQSVSRTMDRCVTPRHLAAARAFVADVALIEANRDLLAMGAHVPGQDPALDRALARAEAIEAFLRQPAGQPEAFATTVDRLVAVWGDEEAPPS
ncbi:MAG: FliI/YscN family ATPase [Sphingomonadaceae bacterium]|uniref:FliI/YscN family ATPase n=1 Tax=Thermaurantiacus sp. TaxID=2820283 RepID=UPI00298F11A8|nr:FliI/YscN family ATPase [Thermaurantiacus sp.]MCS6987010.1 FliI/YscN family ATPase [Sphingomonadaceae bacterium]MDW8415652.1 FliI/YscN family ATPase [Thermaurantiacus sp.]